MARKLEKEKIVTGEASRPNLMQIINDSKKYARKLN